MKHSLLTLSTLSFAVSALKLPLRQTKRDSFGIAHTASNVGVSTGQVVALNDNQDLIYLVNVTIAGQPYTLQLDTGSSDLWISVPDSVPGNQTNLNANLTYGLGYAYGPIATAEVKLAQFDVPAQAYVAAKQTNNPALQYGAQGIAGCSFTRLSSIDMIVNQTGGDWGRSMLYNIFSQNPEEPNYMSFSLERVNDPKNEASGTFTIGEIDQRYAGVANTARISTFPDQNPDRWSLLVDGLTVNGQTIRLSSTVKDVPSDKAVALMDSGTSLVYAPSFVVNAVYGNVPGAQYSSSLSQWIVPCDAEVDVSIIIKGRSFDIHPLDTVQPTTSGSQTCTGSWISQTLAVGTSEFDIIFGDAVMRSIYTVFDYGTIMSNGQMSDPYMLMWSLVNGSQASDEFHQVRGGTSSNTFTSNDNVNAPSSSSNSSSLNSGGSSSDISDLQNKVNRLYKWAPLAVGVAGLNLLVMLVVLIVSIVGCVRRRRNDRSIPPSGSFVPLPLGASSHNYRPVSLQETPKYNPGARYSDQG